MSRPTHSASTLQETIDIVNKFGGDIRAAARSISMDPGTLRTRYKRAVPQSNSVSQVKCVIATRSKKEIAADPFSFVEAPSALRAFSSKKEKVSCIDFSSRKYVITAAQNATPVSPMFFEALENYCAHNGAQLIVIPYRYKNPTSQWTDEQEGNDYWAPEVAKYLLDKRVCLTRDLVVLADIKTQPTASRPLSGFQSLTGGQSAIVGHPKLEFETVPTPQHKLPKILTTTGACTLPNYGEGKAGKIGTHHHTLGACVVEIEDDAFHIRQINATWDGSFYDLTTLYSAAGVKTGINASALIMGDSHIEVIDENVVAATFGPGSICDALKPQYLLWHDVIDQYARNHHHKGDPFIAYAKHTTGIKNNVEKDLRASFEFIDKHSPSYTTNIFVASNHVDALKRWVKENAADPTKDPENLVFWAKTFVKMLEGTKMGPTGASVPDPFILWAREWLGCAHRSVFLKRDESCQICGIELSYHGDAGPGGSKGSIGAFGRIGVKTVIAHGHGPGIRDGVYQVGTSSRYDLEYASGPSKWLHTHCVIYPNGKRSLISIIGTKWRIDPPMTSNAL